jgi:hypothetical protein
MERKRPSAQGRMMPELISQLEAGQIASLAAWWVYEWKFFCLMADAHFEYQTIQTCMTMEAA